MLQLHSAELNGSHVWEVRGFPGIGKDATVHLFESGVKSHNDLGIWQEIHNLKWYHDWLKVK